ncbi:unnamed protein product [Triticum aestivum]|uniref:Uncharacterized protein n=1 Tax=Triticum aestivum TaxID=4565 RepID=A0A7H4LER2_WHEAT|nr:unnamed protein product [Triticum aestivum]
MSNSGTNTCTQGRNTSHILFWVSFSSKHASLEDKHRRWSGEESTPMAVWLFFLLVTLALPHVGNGSTNCDAVLIASLVQEQCDGEPVTGSCCEVLRTIITPSRGKLPCLKMVLDQPEVKYSGFTRGLLLDMAKSCTASRAPPPADVTAGSVGPKDRVVDVHDPAEMVCTATNA